MVKTYVVNNQGGNLLDGIWENNIPVPLTPWRDRND